MKTIKGEISKVFADLRKYGFLVFNFNSNWKLNRGKMTGFVDYVIIGDKSISFIEVKLAITHDKFSEEQLRIGNKLSRFDPPIYYYMCVGLEQAKEIQEFILQEN